MPGTIIVKPIQAKLDKDEGALTKFDPYCVAIVGENHVESEVCKKGGKNPAWNDALALKRNDEPYCYLEVKNKSLIKDKMLGICAIDLDELAKQGNTQKWYELYYDKKHAGEILVEARMANDDGFQGGIEGTRVLSPERPVRNEYQSFIGSYEGTSTHHSSSKKQEHIVGYSPFPKKTSGLEATMSSAYRDSPIEKQYDNMGVYESQSTVKDIVSALDTRDFSSTSYINMGYTSTYPIENQVERELSDLQSKVDQILYKCKAMEEERIAQESVIFQTPSAPVQSFQRQDSIPNEGPIKEVVALMPNPQHKPIHASHDKFGSDTNSVSKVGEFKEKLLERVTMSKNMMKERFNLMVSKEQEFGESSNPSLKHKVLKGIGKAMAKRQFNSEKKVYRREEQEGNQKSDFKEKIFGGMEQITHSSIKSLSKLEDRLREKREAEEMKEKPQKKEGLKEKVEYVKDITREKMLARLKREGVDEGVQTEQRYLDEEPGKIEMMKEKVEHVKELAKEKIDEVKHKKSGKKEIVVVEEEDTGVIDKIREGIAKGAKHVAIKMAKKKLEKAEENDEMSHPEKKKRVRKVVREVSGSDSEEVLEAEQHMPKAKKTNHKKSHEKVVKVKRDDVVLEEEEGVVDKIKEKITKGAKHVALKAAANRLEKLDEDLEHPKKNKKVKHIKEVEKYEESSDEEVEEEPSKVEMVKEKIKEGAEKVKEAVMERKAQTEVKKSRRKTIEPMTQEHEEGNLKRKFMEEIEQIMSFAKEKIDQFGTKETEEHAKDQRIYDELTRSAERAFDYGEIRRERANSLNTELIEGMKDLTATLDRLQQRIESRIGSQYGYNSGVTLAESEEMKKPGMIETVKEKVKEGVEKVKNMASENRQQEGFYYRETDIMIPLNDDAEKPGVVETIKQKVKEGVEQAKNMTQKENQNAEKPSGPIAELMDNLSKEVQQSNIPVDDKIYMTKEYKEELREEERLKNEKMDALKSQVKEGLEQVKNMTHVSKQEVQQEGFYYGETDIMIPLSDNTEKPGMVETVKQKVKEGVEQVKSMAHLNPQETKPPSGPIAELMDQLSEEISQPKVESSTEFEAENQGDTGMLENIKQKIKEGVEQVKHLAHKDKDSDQETQIYSGMGVNFLTEGLPHVHEIPESPHSSIFKLDETKAEEIVRYDTEKKPAGIAGTIKEKIKQGIEQVKVMMGKGEIIEEDEMTASEAFKPKNELMRSPQLSANREQGGLSESDKPADMLESVYFTAPRVENNLANNNMVSSEVYYPSQETIGLYNNGLEVKQPDVFESVDFEGESRFAAPTENRIYESQYIQQIKTPFDEDYRMSTSDQQLIEGKENEQPVNYFTEAFDDLTNSFSKKTNW